MQLRHADAAPKSLLEHLAELEQLDLPARERLKETDHLLLGQEGSPFPRQQGDGDPLGAHLPLVQLGYGQLRFLGARHLINADALCRADYFVLVKCANF